MISVRIDTLQAGSQAKRHPNSLNRFILNNFLYLRDTTLTRQDEVPEPSNPQPRNP